jgi:dTDP-4-amino-4,6-dideoxygalactose transaminase
MSTLALLGGPPAVTSEHEDMFHWPIVTSEDEQAVLEVLRKGSMSSWDITMEFEREFAAWQGAKYALAHSTGTGAIHAALYGCHVGVGDEVLCPTITYWASALPCYSLGATPVFVESHPETFCIDPTDIEHRITPRTKALVVVHLYGYPCDMDPIMEIARRRGVKVIEDVSHAQGSLYHGRKCGMLGDVGAMSLMTGKSLAIGEAGILVTDDREIYDRALAFGHYERYDDAHIETNYLQPGAGLPLGGYKYRMHQMSSAVGRVQLRHYDERRAEIDRAMNYFWDALEGQPGLRAHRPPAGSGTTMGGWYAAQGEYVSEELEGLSVTRFTEALRAEGCPWCGAGGNKPLHLHPLLNTTDVYGHGKPTRIANAGRDLRQPAGSLPMSEAIAARTFGIPWFKHYQPEVIDEYVGAFKKVIANYRDLLPGDPGNPEGLGNWHLSRL